LFIGVIASLALVLGVVAVFGARRARKAKLAEAHASERHAEKMRAYERQKAEREAQHAAQLKKHLEGIAIAQQQTAAAIARGLDTGPVFCPSCRKEYPPGTAFCSVDSNRLISIRGHEALLGGPSGGICPVCQRGFNPGVKVCPDHGEELLPAPVAGGAAAPAQQAAAAPRRGKICPKCGTHFDGKAAFCGQDGSPLVLVN
jgi:predicted amidophosphoribosyltransferase